MTVSYVPPGVSIKEQVTPQIVPLVSSSTEVALVGFSTGHRELESNVTLTENEAKEAVPVQIPGITGPGQLSSVISVRNSKSGVAYAETSWKLVKNGSEEYTGEIELIPGKAIESGTEVIVLFIYVPEGYFNPVRFSNLIEVEQRFGSAINSSGSIVSPLTLGAQKAFENGAGTVICQPLFYAASGEPKYNSNGFITNAIQPTHEQKTEPSVWQTTYKALAMVQVIDLITPVVGASEVWRAGKKPTVASELNTPIFEIFNHLLSYEQERNKQNQYLVGVFGEDSSGGLGGEVSVIREHAQKLREFGLAQQNIMINTANYGVTPNLGGEKSVGAQYVAAAVAGALAARPASVSLTRRGIVGFTKINDPRTPEQKNEDAANGEMVIEQLPGNFLRCRHAITLANNEGTARSEVSVVRAKFVLIESVRQTLENQIVGQIIADAQSPITVRSAIVGVLSSLQQSGQILEYSTPICQLASLEPATITASFSYRPAFTLNYIDITFSLNLASQTVAVETSSP